MLARVKTDAKSMTKYFHDKISLLKKCQIEGVEAISCLIRGLPLELRANAKAFQCETPQQLYFGYLSSFENYKKIEANASIKKMAGSWRRSIAGVAVENESAKVCYACRRRGHEVKDCRTPRCDIC